MASPNNSDSVLAKGTIITFGSWVLVADGSSGFDSRLVDSDAPGTSESTRRRATDEFVDHLDEIPLPASVKEIQKQPDFDATISLSKTPSELEEDLDHLLEASTLGTLPHPKQDRSEIHNEPERYSPRFDRSSHTLAGPKEDSFSDSGCEEIVPKFLDPDTDRAFIDYLNKLDGPDSFDDLNEWSDDIDLFMEGLSNPDKIEELWEKSKAKKF